MFKSIGSFFSRLVGSHEADQSSSTENESTVLDFRLSIENKKEEEVEKPSVKIKEGRRRSSILPDLPSIETILDYASERTLSFQIPKNQTESFILRPIIPSDRDKMYSILNKGDISSNSLFMRFTTAKKTFTEKELDYFTRLDFKTHNGVGVVLDKVGYPGVGTSRYIVDADNPTVAEWAVTVVDKFHGQGIGVILFYSICILAELKGIKKLKAVINPDNHVVLNWLFHCNSYECYEDESLYYVIDLPIPDTFFRYKELGERIRNALSGHGQMDNASLFATNLELKQFYDAKEARDSDTEDFTVTCSSYDSDSRSRLFTSNNQLLCEMMDDISISSRSDSIDDFDIDF